MKVYQAINNVQAELAQVGISKDRRNTQGAGYNFRGIDDVYNAVSPLLAKHGLCILPRMLSRVCEERQSKAGGALFYITVEAEFDLVCAEDGSKHTIRTFGEAMDSGDKGTNKAMSAAYKYAAFQTFAIPTEADNDADAHTHQVAPRSIRHSPTQGAMEALQDDERRQYLTLLASTLAVMVDKGEVAKAYERLLKDKLDDEEYTALWEVLKDKSYVRSKLKAHGEALRAQKQAQPA